MKKALNIEAGETVQWTRVREADGKSITVTVTVDEVRTPINIRGNMIVELRGVTTDTEHAPDDTCDGAILDPEWDVEVL